LKTGEIISILAFLIVVVVGVSVSKICFLKKLLPIIFSSYFGI